MEDERILRQFEKLIKEVDAIYRVFKINKETKEPIAKRRMLEQLYDKVRNISYQSMVNNYKKNNLLQRYNTLKEKWDIFVDEKETGIIKGTKVEYAEIKPQTHSEPETVKKPKPETETDNYKNIYNSFKEANEKLGKKVAGFEKFKQTLEHMEKKLKAKTNAKGIDFIIKIENGKPALKAKIKK